MRKSAVASVLFTFVFSLSCNTTEVPPPPGQGRSITLSVEDVGVTEAWIRVTPSPTVSARTVVLERDNQPIDTILISSVDTLVFDDELGPGRLYEFRSYVLGGSSAEDTSHVLQVATLDTTSHQMIWQVDTLGDGSSSILYDVAIINDSVVYAVGEIFVKDSLGNWVNPPYNLARWNGWAWESSTILYNYQGQNVYVQLQSLLAYHLSSIWVGGNGLMHWNGERFEEVEIPSAVWGTSLITGIGQISTSALYIVGQTGSIAQYDNGSWRLVESGTTTDVVDVWGDPNPSGTGLKTLAVASSPEETKIIFLSGGTARDTLDWPTMDRLSGVWIDKGSVVYVSGAGIWRHRGSVWNQMSGLPEQVFLTAVRGTAENDIFAVAWRGIVTHFNGVSWHQYTEISEEFNFTAVAVSEDLVVAVGFTGGLFSDKAVALVGRRIP